MTIPAKITNRERFCRVYDFQEVDRVVHWEAVEFWGQTVAEWKTLGGLPTDAIAMEYYGMDPRPAISGGLGLTSMALSGSPVNKRLVESDERNAVWENDLGKVWRDRRDGVSMPQWLKFPVESDRDWAAKIKPRLCSENHDFSVLQQEIEALNGCDDPVGLYLVGLYAFWRDYWGEEKLAYAFYDYPDTLHDMAHTWLKMLCECTPKVFDMVSFDYVLFHEDMAFKNGPLIGPGLFDEFMGPYYRELFAHLRASGQHRFMLDSDGNNGQVLDRFIELGMNGLFPFEVAAGYDVVEFRKHHPDFFIWGGIDKRVLLGTKEDIKHEIMSKVPVLLESGGYMPSLDHSVPPCSQGYFEYYLEMVRDLGG